MAGVKWCHLINKDKGVLIIMNSEDIAVVRIVGLTDKYRIGQMIMVSININT